MAKINRFSIIVISFFYLLIIDHSNCEDFSSLNFYDFPGLESNTLIPERPSNLQTNQNNDVNNIEEEENENDFCEASEAITGLMDSELQSNESKLNYILDKLESKGNNHLACVHMKDHANLNLCKRGVANGTEIEAKCGGSQYDQKIAQYNGKKACMNALILGQSLISEYIWPEKGSALDKWINQYEKGIKDGGIDSELQGIYKSSITLMEGIRDDIRKVLKSFSTKEIKEIWKERKSRVVGLMCLIGEGDSTELQEQITVNDDLLVIKLQFDDLVQRMIKEISYGFDNFGTFITNINSYDGYIDQLKKIHENFHVYRMKKLAPALESSPHTNTVLNPNGLIKKLPHIENRTMRKKHKKHKKINETPPSLLEYDTVAGDPNMENAQGVANMSDNFIPSSNVLPQQVNIPTQSNLPTQNYLPPQGNLPTYGMYPNQQQLNPSVQSVAPTAQVMWPQPSNDPTTQSQQVQNQQIQSTQNNFDSTVQAPIGQHDQVNDQQIEVSTTSSTTTLAPMLTATTSSKVDESEVTIATAIQDTLLELNIFKVANNTLLGETDSDRVKKTVESSFLDIKDTDCLLKLFLGPQAALVSIIQIFEEFTPDPIIDLREWYNKTMDDGGQIIEGVSPDTKGVNMTKYVHRFSKFMDLSYQSSKKKGLYKLDNLAELSIGDPMIEKVNSTILNPGLLQLTTTSSEKEQNDDYSDKSKTSLDYYQVDNFDNNQQSFVDSMTEQMSSQNSSPTIALLSSDSGLCPAAQMRRLNCENMQVNMDEIFAMMGSNSAALYSMGISLTFLLASSIIFIMI